ncbi:hypothetical protein [uncultured Shewanella sp.]|nr:hypothetical protein [uncultured Shewanella sp.]
MQFAAVASALEAKPYFIYFIYFDECMLGVSMMLLQASSESNEEN